MSDDLFPLGYTRLSSLRSDIWLWMMNGKTFARVPEEKAVYQVLIDLSHALAWEGFPAFGIRIDTGELVTIPTLAWRFQRSGSCAKAHRIQALDAFDGEPVLVSRDPDVWCSAAVETKSIAEWLGASFTPDPPAISPAGRTAFVKPAGEDAMHAWMRGYAQAQKDAGRVIKRNDALSILRQHFPPPNTTREHEAAYEALPFPDLRNGPRTPKDDQTG